VLFQPCEVTFLFSFFNERFLRWIRFCRRLYGLAISTCIHTPDFATEGLTPTDPWREQSAGKPLTWGTRTSDEARHRWMSLQQSPYYQRRCRVNGAGG
jgi:hypothetical protein